MYQTVRPSAARYAQPLPQPQRRAPSTVSVSVTSPRRSTPRTRAVSPSDELRPKYSRDNSSGSMHTVSLDSPSSTSWDVVSNPFPASPRTPSRRHSRAVSPRPSQRSDDELPYLSDRNASARHVAILLSKTECEKAWRKLSTSKWKPRTKDVARLIELHEIHLQYHRDLFLSGARTSDAQAHRVWQTAITPVLDDKELYARYPVLKAQFLSYAYGVYERLLHDVPRHRTEWMISLRDLARKLVRVARDGLDETMDSYTSSENGKSVTDVSRSFLNVSRWERAKQHWKTELRADEMLEASLDTLTSDWSVGRDDFSSSGKAR